MIYTVLDLIVGTAASLALQRAFEGGGSDVTGGVVERARRVDERAQFVKLATGSALALVLSYALFRGVRS